MGERTSALLGVRSIQDIHEEYSGKASRMVKTDETLNYARAENSSKKLAQNLTKDVKSSISQSTDNKIEQTIDKLDKEMKNTLGVGLTNSQKASMMSKAKGTVTGKFKGLTLSQRLKNSQDIVQQRMTQYAKQGMIKGQQGVNKFNALRFINTPSSQGLISGGSIINRNSRLAISEINRAEQNTTIAFLDELNLLGRWTLGSNHKKYDICDIHAQNTGEQAQKLLEETRLQINAQGVYTAKEMPQYPHPYCECHIDPLYSLELGMATVTRKQVFENIGQELTTDTSNELDTLGSEYYETWKENEIKYGSSLTSSNLSAQDKEKALARMKKRLKKGVNGGTLVQDSALDTAIRKGGYRAYSSIASDLGMSSLPQDVVDKIGVDSAVKILADEIQEKGVAEQAIKALQHSLDTDVAKALRNSQRQATKQLKEVSVVKKAFKDGEISKRSAQRQRALLMKQAREELGDAVGYSKATQGLIEALQTSSKREYVAISVKNKTQATKLAKQLGLDKTQYKVMQKNSKFVVNKKGISAIQSFGRDKQGISLSTKANRLRTAKISENWRANGVKDTFINPKTGQEEVLKMLPAQQRGAKFIAEQQNALINYQVGAGKTLTSIGGIGELQAQGKAKKVLYVTMNNGLAGQYVDEVQTFSTLTASTVKGANFDYKGTDKLITSISRNQLVRDFDAIKDAGFDTVVIDEAHTFMTAIGKDKTVPIELIQKLQGVETKVAMTGTPITDSIDGMYDLVKWLNPDAVGSKSQFASTFSNFGELSTIASEQAKRELKQAVDPFLISAQGKRKGKLIEKVVNVSLNKEDKAYLLKKQSLLDRAVAEGTMSRSRAKKELVSTQASLINNKSTAKLNALNKLLDQVDGKTVIHVQSTSARKKIVEMLGEENVYLAKTGGTKGKQVVQAFRQDKDAKILVVGSQLNTGVNLDFADNAIIFDRPDSAYILEQLQARTHRGLKATDTKQYFLQTQTDYDRELTQKIEKSMKETKVLDTMGKVADSDLKRIFEKLIGGR